MHVKVITVTSSSTDKTPSDDELAESIQILIDRCHQIISVNFVTDGSGRGMFTLSYQDYESNTGGSCSPVAVRATVISVADARGYIPSNDQLGDALQSLLDDCHQIVAVTAVTDGPGIGQYKISFLDYSPAYEPVQETVSFAKMPAAFAI